MASHNLRDVIQIQMSADFQTSSNTLSSQMLWPTWPWSPRPTSPASLTLPSLASTGSGVLPTLIWTSPETTKSSFYPNLPILNCTKGEIRCWRLETFETLSISASSIVNPHRRFPHESESPWSTTLTEVSVSPVRSTHQEVAYASHWWCFYSVPRSQLRPGSSHVDCEQRRNSWPQHAAAGLRKERCDLEIQRWRLYRN